MLAIERKKEILEKLKSEQRVLVSELAAHYQVTEETIRRDLEKLENEGFATKTYGGAIWGNSTKTDLSYTIRNKTNVEAKNTIGDLANALIQDGDHLILDDSSTSLYIVRHILSKKNISIITNSVEILGEIGNKEDWTVISTGGRLKPESMALVGSLAHETIRTYHVDKAFISCKGLDQKFGISDSSEFHASTKQVMLQAANTKILAIDATKFDKTSFIKITDLKEIEIVLTDKKPSQAWLDAFKKANVRCIYP